MYLTLETCIKWIKIPVVVFERGRIKVEEIFLSSLSAFADPDNFPFSGGGGGGDSRYIFDDFLQYVKLKYLFISSGVHTSEPPLDPHPRISYILGLEFSTIKVYTLRLIYHPCSIFTLRRLRIIIGWMRNMKHA